jgi:glycosyltransferase involved in cell wall biosynthesis
MHSGKPQSFELAQRGQARNMKKVLYITATLPALTVTFIYKEVFRLRVLGMEVSTVSMNTPRADQVSAAARELYESTHYLDTQGILRKLGYALLTTIRHPLRMSKCIWQLLTARPVKIPRDYFRLAYHVIEAAYLAVHLKDERPDHIHCHFINGPTSIGMFLGILLDIPYSFTMHASMIWRDPVAFRNKLLTSAFCISISEYNRKYVLETYGNKFAPKIHIVHCGIEPNADRTVHDKKNDSPVFQMLGVGQLNRRKGFHILIPALRLLRDQGVSFHCTIIGDGDEKELLSGLIERNELGDYVTLAGALLHEEVENRLTHSDAFVLPCVISEDGWRDGIPVALMEAMFCRLPVVSTNILGLPELIENDVSGLLVPANDSEALAVALKRLAEDRLLRKSLGEHGREKVLREFNNERSAAQLQEYFEAC